MKGSCIVAVSNSRLREAHIIDFSGGQVNEDLNIWEEEAENSLYVDDVFYSQTKKPPNFTPGLWVWEGEMTYVHEDAPVFDGEWRKATHEDVKHLLGG